ncbi:dihydroorotase [Candidatus Merdisoma sp. HCP28S3_D10]|uniref:dihydroorotase n=1 Tax=unclassified Candidatus Merdisoma TaxID=3099611 RepID=UPI003F8C5E66
MIGIRGGRILDPVSGREFTGDLILEKGTVKAIGAKLALEGCEEIIDAAGMVVAPGLVDVHVHFRDPGLTYKEDIQTGATAAAAGGFTTVICMANTRPVVDNAEVLSYVLEQGRKTGIHVLSCVCVTKGMQGKELVDMDGLRAAGAAGFTDDGIPILDEAVLKAALRKAEELQVPVSLHEEDPKLIANNGINRGPVSEKLGIGGSPAEAEITMVERDCRLAEETGASVNIQHISTAGAVEAVRASKKRGSHVTAEAAPHHFTLTDEAVLSYGTLAKMNPPLRTEADRQAVIEGLKDGTIDMIATDHAPHSMDEKNKPLTEAPSGIIGLETSLALSITKLVKPGHLTLMELMRKMSQNPAALYHLPFPGIAEGAPADLVIFDENEEWKAEDFRSKAVNTPFEGWTLTGRVHYTICDGKIVYKL